MQVLQELDWLSEADLAERIAGALARRPSLERDIELAILSIGAGRFEQADDYAESAYAAMPEDAYAAYTCGVVRVHRRDWELALEALSKVPAEFERASEVVALCSVTLLELGRVDEAARMSRSLAAVDDETYGTLCALRARCSMAAGDQVSARQYFLEALSFAPKLDWVRKMLASLPKVSLPSDVPAVVI